jgi:hypothetical protein
MSKKFESRITWTNRRQIETRPRTYFAVIPSEVEG